METLSNREIAIVQGVYECLCNKQIAYKLNISFRTVRWHLYVIIKKLKLKNRTQLAVFAYNYIQSKRLA